MKPLLFLDFDGVLNGSNFFRNQVLEGKVNKYTRTNEDEFDPFCIELLNEIVEESDCLVVISSSWRLFYDLEEIKSLLARVGFKHPDSVIGKTEDLSTQETKSKLWIPKERGDEIQKYLVDNPGYTRFAVLDDGTDMSAVAENWVRTLMDTGLGLEEKKKVLELLNCGFQP